MNSIIYDRVYITNQYMRNRFNSDKINQIRLVSWIAVLFGVGNA